MRIRDSRRRRVERKSDREVGYLRVIAKDRYFFVAGRRDAIHKTVETWIDSDVSG